MNGALVFVSMSAVLLGAVPSGLPAPTPLPRTVPLFTTTSSVPVVLPAVFDGRVLLQTDVDNHELWLHLDTGSRSLYLGAQDAEGIGLSADPATGYSNPVPVRLGAVQAMARFQILPTYGFESGERRVSGIVGGPLFHANILTIDYPAKTVTFYPPGSFVPPPGVSATPIDLVNNAPVVTASVGDVPGRFVIDTGAQMTELSSGFARRVRLGFYRGNVVVASGGEDMEAVYEVPAISLAGAIVHRPEVAIADPPRIALDGIIGRDILARFRLTLDYAHFQAYFVPVP